MLTGIISALSCPLTPDDIVYLSNSAHFVSALVGMAFASVTLAENSGYLVKGWLRYIQPSMLAVSGVALMAVFFALISPSSWGACFSGNFQSPDGAQHAELVALTILGGTAEVVNRRMSGRYPLSFGYPLAALGAGIIFIIHPAHGMSALAITDHAIHLVIGVCAVLVSFFYTASLFSPRGRTLRSVEVLLLFSIAALLLVYREPPPIPMTM